MMWCDVITIVMSLNVTTLCHGMIFVYNANSIARAFRMDLYKNELNLARINDKRV